MYTVTAQDFASETGVSVGDLQEKARRGETVLNVDLAEYGVFEHYGDTRVLTKVRMPNSLAANLGPGGVSETSAGDAYIAGRESMKPESSGEIPQTGERENATETGESEGGDDTSETELPALNRPVVIDADNLPQNVFEGDGSEEETGEETAVEETHTTTDTVERDNPEMEQMDQLVGSLFALFGGASGLDEDQRERVLRNPYGLS
ncbi:hypothetical protein [Salinibacter ruber]|uniref:hypothetical protein n=1 Tax=Salinibacter ruber TaxID=146919 RepID=UPI002168EECF|nr:hypothetical protein [Salinibacter ruber]MCS4057937.1 hypothetical protein [Salinibacter ruber]